MHDEKTVLQDLRQGDPQALGQIYLACKDELLGLAIFMLANEEAAEDCLHDVFVHLAGHARELKIRCNLKGYLRTCIVNRARDQFRGPFQPTSLEAAEFDPPYDNENPVLKAGRQEEDRFLLSSLAELPDDQRQIIALHVKGEMSFRAIARLEGLSINTVMSRYRYGIEKLRKLLQGVNL